MARRKIRKPYAAERHGQRDRPPPRPRRGGAARMIAGVDVGTLSLKVSILDERLETKGVAARRYQPIYPRPGWVEQDPGLWEQALGPAIAEALSVADARPAQVRAIGICGQLDG